MAEKVTKVIKVIKDVEVVRSGTQIIIPQEMSIPDAIEWLKKKAAAEEQLMSVNIPIPCYPFDGFVAFQKAIKEVYGFAKYSPIDRGWFGVEPPSFISIPISDTERIDCPQGTIRLPGLQDHLVLNYGNDNGKPALRITGSIQQKHMHKVRELARLTQQYVDRESIYKGKALTLGLRKEHRNPGLSVQSVLSIPPVFMKQTSMTEDDIILNRAIEAQVRSLVWAPIEKTQQCRKSSVPLKRGVLLEGEYGTGKTLLVNITSRKCTENGWTFIYLADCDLLATAIEMAAWYQPAVIFCEDIDAIAGTADRTDPVNSILNVIDGIDKSREIIVILTTNHVETINRALLRPGRLDAIISFRAPDAEASDRLMRHYAKTSTGCLIDPREDISAAAEVIKGAPASMIQEVVERSKLAAISRSGDASQLTGDDLLVAANAMQSHLVLLKGQEPETNMSVAIKAASAFGKGFSAGIFEGMDGRNLPSFKSAGTLE